MQLSEHERQLCVAVPGAVGERVHEEEGRNDAELNLKQPECRGQLFTCRNQGGYYTHYGL